MTSFYPNYNLPNRIQSSKLAIGTGEMPSMRLDSVNTKKNGDFQTVFKGMLDNLNKELNAPDELLKDAMSGNSNVDVHDVMIAMSKSEISINVATTAVGKVIQAYDKIMQIQV
jgi:flagellar hook-basal body complex protein FliE